jgi:GNAT superfamily N-acetyltransferase
VTTVAVTLSDLRARPDFAAPMAQRIWKAWWEDKGTTLAQIAALVDDNLDAEALPFALIAHRGDIFLATASVIVSDCDERPALSPWVAAVWVEPQARGGGIGRAIVLEAAHRAFALGFETIYLCATPQRRGFYTAMGWEVLEENVDGDGLIVFRMQSDVAALT